MDAVKVYQNGGMINRPNLTINELTLFEDYSLLETLDYWPHQVILIGLYTTIAIFSFILNLITIVVLVRCEKICSELYVYLINLSLSDIVMSLLCIPYTYTSFILNRWIFPHFLCPVVNFAQVCSVFVSIWTLAIIGIDRYFAIINPLGGETKWMILNFGPIKHRKKLFIMMTIWLVGILSGSVQFFYTRVVPFPYGSKTLYDCRENLPKRYAKVYTIYLFVGTFGFPLLILVYVYSIIGYHVWRHVAPGNPHHSRDHNNSLTREKVIKILILIVVLFFCLWAPLQIFTLIVEFNERFLQVGSPNDYRLFVYSYLVSHVLAMAHSLVNPIAYCFISHNFWRHFCFLTQRFFVRMANCCTTKRSVMRTQPTKHRLEREKIVLVRDRRTPRTAHSTLSMFKRVNGMFDGMTPTHEDIGQNMQHQQPVQVNRIGINGHRNEVANVQCAINQKWKLDPNEIELNVIQL